MATTKMQAEHVYPDEEAKLKLGVSKSLVGVLRSLSSLSRSMWDVYKESPRNDKEPTLIHLYYYRLRNRAEPVLSARLGPTEINILDTPKKLKGITLSSGRLTHFYNQILRNLEYEPDVLPLTMDKNTHSVVKNISNDIKDNMSAYRVLRRTDEE
jgi:hypothetical protein